MWAKYIKIKFKENEVEYGSINLARDRGVWITILPTASQHKRMTRTKCCIYRVVPSDGEQ
jgi:hypothetical protein